MMRLKYIAGMVFVFMLLTAWMTSVLHGRFAKTESTYYSVLFIIDISGSMNSDDPHRLVYEAAKMFAGSFCSQSTEVGFITFNDAIVQTFPFTSLAEQDERLRLKNAINSIVVGGRTDLGLALRHGVNMMAERHAEGRRPIIVLYSDGELANTLLGGRTRAHSISDKNYAIARASQMGLPIHVFGVNYFDIFGTHYLAQISQGTGGSLHMVRNPAALPAMFRDILGDVTGRYVYHRSEIIQVTGQQTIVIDTKGFYADEVNIVLHHEPGTVRDVAVLNHEAYIYNSRHFTGIKIQNPASNEVSVSFVGTMGSALGINVANIVNYVPVFIFPQIELIFENPAAHEGAIRANLFYGADEHYEVLSAELTMYGINTGYTETIPMENTGHGFYATFQNRRPGYVNFTVTVTDHEGWEHILNLDNVLFANTPPRTAGGAGTVELALGSVGESSFDLLDFFYDEDGGELSFEISVGGGHGIAIHGGTMLAITPASTRNEFTVVATDCRGGTAEIAFVAVVPFQIFHRSLIMSSVLALTVLIIIFLLLLILLRKKEAPTREIIPAPEPVSPVKFKGARFEGYFLNTLNGNEIPALFWHVSHIENKPKTTLGELFRFLGVNERLPEADRIYFEAGNNGTLIFHHDTNCIINISKRDIPRGNKAVLNYNDKIYITFEDHVTELEVRYKHAQKVR